MISVSELEIFISFVARTKLGAFFVSGPMLNGGAQ